MIAWWLGTALAATPYFGLEWRPLSRQDLVWVDEGRTSGTAVGAFDGTTRPVLSAFGGAWVNPWFGVHAGLGLAQIVSTSQADDVYVQRQIGVVRPSLDLRFGWMAQRLHRPTPWFLLGGWVDVPTVRDVSNGYTDEEQDAADLSADEDRYRLQGGGGRVGFGVDYRLLPGLLLGAQISVGLQRTAMVGDNDATVSLWISTEAALLLTFEWPPEARRNSKRHRDGAQTDDAAGPMSAEERDIQHPAEGASGF